MVNRAYHLSKWIWLHCTNYVNFHHHMNCNASIGLTKEHWHSKCRTKYNKSISHFTCDWKGNWISQGWFWQVLLYLKPMLTTKYQFIASSFKKSLANWLSLATHRWRKVAADVSNCKLFLGPVTAAQTTGRPSKDFK